MAMDVLDTQECIPRNFFHIQKYSRLQSRIIAFSDAQSQSYLAQVPTTCWERYLRYATAVADRHPILNGNEVRAATDIFGLLLSGGVSPHSRVILKYSFDINYVRGRVQWIVSVELSALAVLKHIITRSAEASHDYMIENEVIQRMKAQGAHAYTAVKDITKRVYLSRGASSGRRTSQTLYAISRQQQDLLIHAIRFYQRMPMPTSELPKTLAKISNEIWRTNTANIHQLDHNQETIQSQTSTGR